MPSWGKKWLGTSGIIGLTAFCCFWATSVSAVEYVVNICCDALRPDAISNWVNYPGMAHFTRLRTEGAFTDNARTDYEATCTTPDNIDILTGRPIKNWNDGQGHQGDGHLWGENSGTPWANYGLTLHDAHIPGKTYTFEKGPVVYPTQSAPNRPDSTSILPRKSAYDYVSSVFDVAHDAKLRTGLFAGKARFNMFINSYNRKNSDKKVNKIDTGLVVNLDKLADSGASSRSLVEAWQDQMESTKPLQYSFIHFAEADEAGHKYGWDTSSLSTPYMLAVKRENYWLGRIFEEIDNENSPLYQNTAIVLTADHGGHDQSHDNQKLIADYKVPFYVWGPGVAAGADLYELNENSEYADPGSGRPLQGYFNQPIRCGDSANLCLSLLGLDSIPDSTFDYDQSLTVLAPTTLAKVSSRQVAAGLSFEGFGATTIAPEPCGAVLVLICVACLAIAGLLAKGRARIGCSR
jgi:hypothetical protein